MRKLTLVGVVALWSTIGFAAAPPISPERPITSPIAGPAAYDQLAPRIATDGSEFLAIWTDHRSHPSGPDLYGTTLDAFGNVVEPLNRPLASGLTAAAVAWGGSEYLVAGLDARGGIAIMRVARNGIPLEEPRFIAAGSGGRVSLASTRDGYALVWPQTTATGGLHVVLLNAAGNPYFTTQIPQRAPFEAFALVPFGASYLIFYEDLVSGAGCPPVGCRALRRAIVTVAGFIENAVVFDEMPAGFRTYAAVSGEKSILLVYQTNDGATRSVDYVLFNDEVFPIPTANRTIYIATSPRFADPDLLAVGWDGREYFVTFAGAAGGPNDALAAVRLTAGGALVDVIPAFISSARPDSAAIAATGTTSVLLWSDAIGASSFRDVIGRRASSFSQLLRAEQILISRSAPAQTSLRLAANGRTAIAVWREFAAQTSITASIVGSEAAIAITAPGPALVTSPVAAVLGDGFVVVWREEDAHTFRILARRVRTTGEVLDATPMLIAQDTRANSGPPFDMVDVASSGDTALVVWPGGDGRIHASRITSGGVVSDRPPIAFGSSVTGAFRESPRVTFSAGAFAVLWIENSIVAPTSIYAVRISPAGTVDSPPRVVASGGFAAHRLAVGANSSRVLVTWIGSFSPTGLGRCVYIQQLASSLTPAAADQSPLFCRTEDRAPAEPELVATENEFLLLVEMAGDVTALRISNAGQVVEEFPLSATTAREFGPAGTAIPGAVLVGYSRVPDGAEHANVARIFTRILGVPPSRIRAVRR